MSFYGRCVAKHGAEYTMDVQYRPSWLARLFGRKPYTRVWVGCYAYRCAKTGERAELDFETWLNQLQRKYDHAERERKKTQDLLKEVGWL